MTTSTLRDAVDLGSEDLIHVYRRRRLGYLVTTTLLTLLVTGAVVDVSGIAVYGVDTDHARARADGWELDVRYGTRTRPALATPFDIEVRRAGGFDGPVTVAVTSDYLAMWDENGLDPEPSSVTQDDQFLYWTFEPPPGEVLVVSFDARIEPAAQNGQTGRVAVVDPSGAEVVAVDFRTDVLP